MRAFPAALHEVILQRPHLHPTILIELLHHIPQQSDASALTRTCKAIYDKGTRVLLRRGVTLENGAQISSFCDFLLRDPDGRLPYLRRLHLKLRLVERGVDDELEEDDEDEDSDDSDDVRADVCNVLAKTLALMGGLEDLQIESCEELLERKPAIQKAIMALKGLRRLQVASVGVLTGALFAGMQPSVVELDAHCYTEELWEPSTVASLLTRNQQHLEKFSAWYVEVGTFELQFPRLRALALRSLYGYDFAQLHEAFPNLQYLELSASEERGVEDARRDNTPPNSANRWSNLRYLCGNVDALYALGPVPRVAKVEVDHIHSSDECLSRMRSVVSDTHPTHLVLHTGFYVCRTFDLPKISELLPPEGTPSITHLMLDMALHKLTGTREELMAGMTSLLKKSPIQFFILRIAETCDCDGKATEPPLKAAAAHDGDDRQCQSDDDDANADSDADADGESDDDVADKVKPAPFSIRKPSGYQIAQTLQLAQHQKIARKLAQAGKSLRHVVLKIHRQGDTYWAIERDEKGLQLKKLATTVGAALVHANDLGPNDRSSGLEGIP
ncbi:hypothetical protein FKP32DRAFT_1596899 [Trametes sanguinea]|nr:hypothetical protein FKP32DRAFT_1596899 [Trametes sanguinea]